LTLGGRSLSLGPAGLTFPFSTLPVGFGGPLLSVGFPRSLLLGLCDA
jgi:hypothetical protein